MKWPIAAAAFGLLAMLPGFAHAGVIRGTLTAPTPGGPTVLSVADAYPGHAHAMPGDHAMPRGLVTDAVIYVETIPARAESALATRHAAMARLAQRDQMFVPRVVAVAAGSAVDFPNLDPIYHNVFSLSPTRRFDLGKYPRGSSRQVTFRKAGLVNVYCDIHANMEAFILVVTNHCFARPAASGAFALPDLPAGHYQVVAWHPDLGTRSAAVDVPADGDATVALGY